MAGKEESLTRKEREELRGLFTLGLMAILISLRISQTEVVFVLFDVRYVATGLIDLTLALWGTYAFLIVVSLSSEIIPRRFCEICYHVGVGFLSFSFIVYYAIAVAIATTLPMYLNALIVLVLILPVWYAIAITFKEFFRFARKSYERRFRREQEHPLEEK